MVKASKSFDLSKYSEWYDAEIFDWKVNRQMLNL